MPLEFFVHDYSFVSDSDILVVVTFVISNTLVTITIPLGFCSQIINQKSSTVLSVGPEITEKYTKASNFASGATLCILWCMRRVYERISFII